jgi:hypothetical protein
VCLAGDLLGLVADALEVGDGLDGGHDQPQVVARPAGGWRSTAVQMLVDLDLQRIDPDSRCSSPSSTRRS